MVPVPCERVADVTIVITAVIRETPERTSSDWPGVPSRGAPPFVIM